MQGLSYRRVCFVGCVFGSLAMCAEAQIAGTAQQIATADGKEQIIPSRAVEFKAVESDPAFMLPPTTVDFPHCLSDGSLVLQSVDWDALKKLTKGKFPRYDYVVTLEHGQKSQTILSKNISDLTDFNILDVFPAEQRHLLSPARIQGAARRARPGKISCRDTMECLP